jgi:diguanylate cyclase (GGDEF)-like protein
MLLSVDEGGKIELQAAAGNAERRATVPWTPGSFVGRALNAKPASLKTASRSAADGTTPEQFMAVACQIEGRKRPIGGIYAGFDHPSPLSREELSWLAQAHARLAGLCMGDGGTAVATLLRSAGVDRLTGCLRYERILETLSREVQRSTRQLHSISCCLIDIDHFTAINDEHGHQKGDMVLASAGKALLAEARGFDCVGRLGDDEFIVVMPETSMPEAQKATMRLRFALEEAVTASAGISVTTSAGIAEWERGETMLQLLQGTDSALQSAKARGEREAFDRAIPPARSKAFSALVRRTRPKPGKSGRGDAG